MIHLQKVLLNNYRTNHPTVFSYFITNGAFPVIINVLIAPPAPGVPSFTPTTVVTAEPLKSPAVTLPLMVEVIAVPTIFVVALAVQVEVFFVFHVILEFNFTGFPAAKVATLMGAVTMEPLFVPPVTPPPLQVLTGRLITIVCTFFTVVSPGVIVIFPEGFAQTVPPTAYAGVAYKNVPNVRMSTMGPASRRFRFFSLLSIS